MRATKHDWTTLDPLIARLMAEGWSEHAACKEVGIKRTTYRYHREALEGTPPVHPSVPEQVDMPGSEHQGTPQDATIAEVHQGTLEEYQAVIDEVHQSVPGVLPSSTDEVPLSTPEVHPDVSPEDSSTGHSGVPARSAHLISTPMVHPGTPTAEDWDVWTTVKARWPEVEKILADRQAILSTPRGTPGHTQKKTYVFDVRHIALIEQYANEHRIDLKEVIYAMCEEFFQRRL
jgi:hypothetical protein